MILFTISTFPTFFPFSIGAIIPSSYITFVSTSIFVALFFNTVTSSAIPTSKFTPSDFSTISLFPAALYPQLPTAPEDNLPD